MYQSVDVIWTLLGAAMVFFMQAGFALLRSRYDPGEKHRKHYYEKPDGLLLSEPRSTGLLASALMFARQRGR